MITYSVDFKWTDSLEYKAIKKLFRAHTREKWAKAFAFSYYPY